MSEETQEKQFRAICPYCKRTWLPQSDGFNDHSFCPLCRDERQELAHATFAAQPSLTVYTDEYAFSLPQGEKALSDHAAFEKLFQPRLSLFEGNGAA
jgi:hypothetical protein